MEVGFSLLNNAYIKASVCDYNSTKNYQIRCPFCFEPLFLRKGSRNIPHFSHYDLSINAKTCELRAKKTSCNFLNNEFTEGKGQQLYQHYSVFSNCFALFIGLPNDLYEEIPADEYFHKILDIKRYFLEKNSKVEEKILPQEYIGKYIETNIIYFLNKLKFDNLIFNKTDDEIQNEFFKAYTFFSEQYIKRNFNFTELGIKYRKNNFFYENAEETSKSTLKRILEEETDTLSRLLKYVFNEYEVNLIKKILNLSEETPALCLSENEITYFENSIFETDSKESLSIKKILLFLGQENYFLFKSKPAGTYWIGQIKEINDLPMRLNLILTFSVKGKENPFFQNFPKFSNKLILVHGRYKFAKQKYLELINSK